MKLIQKNKLLYGEVLTPIDIVTKMLNIIDDEYFKDPKLKWLDPGCGTGNFSIVLYNKLLENLTMIEEKRERSEHIIKNMIYMVELREENIDILKNTFGKNANIINKDYLNWETDIKFDIIIGNPPFNSNGIKKVPTNITKTSKTAKIANITNNTSKTIWFLFIQKSINLLKNNGILCQLIPSIWLKPDSKIIYNFMLQYKISYLNCFSNTESNKIFKGNAQTPTCYFLLEKKNNDGVISIFYKKENEYINYLLTKNVPIPVCNIKLINNLQNFNKSSIKVIKTNLPSKKIELSINKTEKHIYPNIKTRYLKNKELIVEYSNLPLIGYRKPKIVLANKMIGLAYLDISGEYGISNRDNYIIYKDKISDLEKIFKFLNTDIIQEVYKSTRYRMMYLEKHAFTFIPDITLIDNFPTNITNESVNNFFMTN